MTEENQEWFIAERARALAMVTLTRRDDLVVMNATQGVGLQFVVYVTKDEGHPAVRQFGVFLRGSMGPVTETHLNEVLRPAMQSILRVGKFPYPVLLFHFTMDDDRGNYAWVAEPAVADAGPRLVMHETPRCHKLDRAALDEIVAKVEEWYDAFFARLAVTAP